MGHTTLIDGTEFEIVKGLAKVFGTSYEIISGITKIYGSNYNISFLNLPRVGGKIFYIDPNDNGATYLFYDVDGNEINWQSLDDLSDAYYYSVSGTPTRDKFYVYATEDGSPYTNYLISASKYWAPSTSIDGTTDGFGVGKANSDIMLSKYAEDSGCIWYDLLYRMKLPRRFGNDDWYIGSMEELIYLKEFFGATYDGNPFEECYIWSSSEYNDIYANFWGAIWDRWTIVNKDKHVYGEISLYLRSF